jgi:hypothetical protein
MKNGDISNETSPRIIVLAEVVASLEEIVERKLLSTKTSYRVQKISNEAVAQLWLLGNRYGVSIELAGFEDEHWSEELLQNIMDRLDRRGGNPFNYAQMYLSPTDLVDELPYRTNFKGVVDIPTRVARYGSWGVELNNL